MLLGIQVWNPIASVFLCPKDIRKHKLFFLKNMDLFSIQPKKKVKSNSHHHDPCSLFTWASYGLEKTSNRMHVDLAVRQLIGMLYLWVL